MDSAQKQEDKMQSFDAPDQDFISGYITHKAKLLLKLGPRQYGLNDALGQPRASLDEYTVDQVLSGSSQIINGSGFDPSRPLENISVPGLYAILDTFHFRVLRQKAKFTPGQYLGELNITHQVTAQTGILYYRPDLSD